MSRRHRSLHVGRSRTENAWRPYANDVGHQASLKRTGRMASTLPTGVTFSQPRQPY